MDNKVQLDLISNIIDDIEAVICAKDTDGRHFIVNRFYEDATGIDRQQVFGKTDEEIFSLSPEVARKIRDKDLEVINSKHKLSFEEQVPDANGEMRCYLTMKSPVLNTDGKVIGIVCLAVDINKQKKLEQKLQKATTAKNLFLTKMSHEIRTPISAIAGYLDLIEHSEPIEHKKYLNNISTSVEHLLNVVNDIIDISSVEEKQIVLEHKRFNLIEVLDSVISTLKFQVNLNKIRVITKFEPHDNKYFYGDKTRVKQIILHLISNSVEFSKGGAIEVRIAVNKSRYDGKKKVTILVKDKAAYPLQRFEHYFERTELDLAIVKELSTLMNGSVKTFLTEGKSTLIGTSIHLQEATKQIVNKPRFTMYDSSGSNTLKNKVICIAEDQTFNREILKSMAQNEGAMVISFEDGVSLIKAVKSKAIPEHVDCFFLDIHMPLMGGVETLTLLREFPEYEHTPAYFVTADAVKDNREHYWSKNYNLTGIYLKPLKRHELVNCVTNKGMFSSGH